MPAGTLPGGAGKGNRNPAIHADEKSDIPIVPKNSPNNGCRPAEATGNRRPYRDKTYSLALTPVVMPHLKANRLRPIAVTSATPIGELPNLPVAAYTVPGFEALNWCGVMMPKNTHRAIVANVNGDISKVLTLPDGVHRLADASFHVTFSTPEGLTQFIRKESDIGKWVIREAKIPVD